MSNLTTTAPLSTGPELIQGQDFWQSPSVLHPLIVGTIILIILFTYLRLSSNRSVAPFTLFDSIVSVAMGSTLAGVINGTALVRGIIALGVLLFWQYFTSYVAMRWPGWPGRMIASPALIIAYRGRQLNKLMHKHRVSQKDLHSALRMAGVWNICEVEVVAIEPNGKFSVFLRKNYPKDYEPDVLWNLDGYRALREHEDEEGHSGAKDSSGKDGEDDADNAC